MKSMNAMIRTNPVSDTKSKFNQYKSTEDIGWELFIKEVRVTQHFVIT